MKLLRSLLAMAALVLLIGSMVSASEIPKQVIGSGGNTGTSTNFILSGTVGQTAVGVGTSTNFVLYQGFWSPTVLNLDCCQNRGDYDHDGIVNVADIVAWAKWSFQQNPIGPACEESTNYYPECDFDANDRIDVADITAQALWMFKEGEDPVPCP